MYKLIRDLVPQLMAAGGRQPKLREAASDEEFGLLLRNKLVEELGAYLSKGTVAELCDIQEAVYALAVLDHDMLPEELEDARRDRQRQRGGFASRTVWVGEL